MGRMILVAASAVLVTVIVVGSLAVREPVSLWGELAMGGAAGLYDAACIWWLGNGGRWWW